MLNRKTICKRKLLEEYYDKIYEIEPYFYEHHKDKIKIDEIGHKYIPFRIDVYFLNIIQLQKLIKNNKPTDIFFLEKKEAIEKKIDCKFIRTNSNKENYVFYKTGRMQRFISQFKNKRSKEQKKK